MTKETYITVMACLETVKDSVSDPKNKARVEKAIKDMESVDKAYLLDNFC